VAANPLEAYYQAARTVRVALEVMDRSAAPC
jgi:hypothetical protein